MKYLQISIFILLCFSLHLFAIGQSKLKNDRITIWKLRCDTITSSVIKDADKIEPTKRALIYTRLGDLWWKSDSNQSNIWFEKAVDLLIYKADTSKDKTTYFQTTREILKIISNRNQKQTNRLIKILSEDEKSSEKDKNINADTLIEFALSFVKDNPEKAVEIGILSFKIGQPTNFYKLYWELKRNAPNSADKFIKSVISSVSASPNASIIAGLKTAIFPEILFPNAPPEILSANPIKTETLNFFADFIIQQQARFSVKTIPSCEPEAFLLVSLKNHFFALLPQKASLAEQAINLCLSDKNKPNQDLANADGKQDIDGLLKLADEAKSDLKVRAYYLFRAVSLANDEEKYQIATDILEEMSKEEKETDLEFWEELQYTIASGLAFQHFQARDLQSTIQTLESVSAENRAFAKIGFALKFSPTDINAREFILERIREARAELSKSAKPFAQKSDFWFQIVKIYSNYSMSTDATESFKEIVKDFNKQFSESKPENAPSIDSEKITAIFSAKLLESQDNYLLAASDSINDQISRIEVNLGFLKTALKTYESINSTQTKPTNK